VLVVIFSLGADSGNVAAALFHILEKAWAVGSFVLHALFDVAIGAVVILRSLSSHFLFDGASPFTAIGPAGIFIFIVTRAAALFHRV
jgi:hypothetical protein